MWQKTSGFWEIEMLDKARQLLDQLAERSTLPREDRRSVVLNPSEVVALAEAYIHLAMAEKEKS